MAETTDNRKIFSLLEVTLSIQKTLGDRYKSMFWVKAEMNKLNFYPHSGHCYPDLVEKTDGKVVAQLRSTLWKDDYNRINRDFLRIVKTPLQDGIQMLFCAKIMFDPMYGLSLRIIDIDPTFSLGELEREKQESIEKLQKEGIFSLNRSLRLPLIPKRIAVISVQTSKGYADFLKVIESSGYALSHMLFPSLLQGDRAAESILYQLLRIKHVIHHFDAVAIIRGGGGEVGLSCFNNYELSKALATFPIPVITGIGHATNETVAEMVAFRNAITPTDLANFILSHFRTFELSVADARKSIVHNARKMIHGNKQFLRAKADSFRAGSKNFLQNQQHQLSHHTRSLVHFINRKIEKEKQLQHNAQQTIHNIVESILHTKRQTLSHLTQLLRKDVASRIQSERSGVEKAALVIRHLDPQNILNRGYSFTMMNGKAITSVDQIHPGDEVVTMLKDGEIKSKVISKDSKHE